MAPASSNASSQSSINMLCSQNCVQLVHRSNIYAKRWWHDLLPDLTIREEANRVVDCSNEAFGYQ